MSIKTKIIQTPKAKILVVGLPDGNELYAESNGCFYTENTNKNREENGEPRNWRIADNRHKLLGRLSELSEEQFSQVVESFGEHNGYRNYLSSSQFTELLKKQTKIVSYHYLKQMMSFWRISMGNMNPMQYQFH